MKRRRFLKFMCGSFAAGCLLGCGGDRNVEDSTPLPTAAQIGELYYLTVSMDVTGSYYDLLFGKDGRALRFLSKMKDQFFMDRMEEHDRIVLSQISGTADKFLLWDGSPRAFQQRFSNQSKFKEFILSRAGGSGSNIYPPVAETIEYTISEHEKNPKARSFTAIFSDFEHNHTGNAAESKARLIQAIRRLAKFEKASIGFYWVGLNETKEWDPMLRSAGFKPGHAVCEGGIREDLVIPTF